jgi:hypothetical protein
LRNAFGWLRFSWFTRFTSTASSEEYQYPSLPSY